MARGVHELRQALTQKNLVRSASGGGEGDGVDFGELTELHTFLDKFYMSRIGIRILIGQCGRALKNYTPLARTLHPLGTHAAPPTTP